MEKFYVKDILQYLGSQYSIIGDSEKYFFTNVKPSDFVEEDTLDWVNQSRKDKETALISSKAKIIICDETIEITAQTKIDKCIIIVENPKFVFMGIVSALFVKKAEFNIHPTAVIHPEAVLAEKVHIGPFTYIGKCTIDEGTIIYGHCNIYDNVVIGKNVSINSGTIIGADGFGYERNEKNEFVKFPHIGGVVIEDNVEIGSNTSIDRGGLGNTIIREGAKIDNLVHIAHNVVIGKHSAIIANAMIAGSTTIGDYTWVSPSASVINYATVGDNALVGMGAVVNRNVPDGETWMTFPAMELSKMKMILRELLKK